MKLLKTLTILLLTIAGWGCLIFAWAMFGQLCAGMMALAMVITGVLGGVV